MPNLSSRIIHIARAISPVYLVECTSPHGYFAVHRRAPKEKTCLVAFADKEHAMRVANSLEAHKAAYGKYPPHVHTDLVSGQVLIPFDVGPKTRTLPARSPLVVRSVTVHALIHDIGPTGMALYVCSDMDDQVLTCVRVPLHGEDPGTTKAYLNLVFSKDALSRPSPPPKSDPPNVSAWIGGLVMLALYGFRDSV